MLFGLVTATAPGPGFSNPFLGPRVGSSWGPSEALAFAEAELSRVLWSLWQPRCAENIPRKVPPGSWLAVDEKAAQLLRREVRLGSQGIEEERLELPNARGPSETVWVRYGGRDGSAAGLPGRVEMDSSARQWSATIEIVAQEVNPTLDDRLFALPQENRSAR